MTARRQDAGRLTGCCGDCCQGREACTAPAECFTVTAPGAIRAHLWHVAAVAAAIGCAALVLLLA